MQCRMRFSVLRNRLELVSSRVVILLHRCCPSHVSGFVVSIIVDSVNAVFVARPAPNVSKDMTFSAYSRFMRFPPYFPKI